MKHLKLISFLLMLTVAGSAQSQSSCPSLTNDAIIQVSSTFPCTAKIVVTAINTLNPQKGMHIIVYQGPILQPGQALLFEECVIVPGYSTLNYVSIPFEYTCGLAVTYEITPTTSSNGECSGGNCSRIKKFGGPEGGPTPIKLSSFYGNRKGTTVQLEWTSEQEINASHYEIQKNIGGSFQSINQVNAKNLSIETKYSFEDQNVTKAPVQYRLRLVDKDGSFTLSNVVSIKSASSVSDVDIYPNPALAGNAKLRISDITDITTIQVFDLSGKMLKNMNVNNNEISLGDLQAGSYLLKMVNAKTGGSATKRFIILN